MASRVLCVLFIKLVFADDLINMQLAPESVIKGIQDLMASRYLRGLADEFVMKAASHLIDQYDNKDKITENSGVPTRQVARGNEKMQNKFYKFQTPSLLGPEINNPIDMNAGGGNHIFQKAPVPRKLEVPSAQVLAFLQEPADDGDNQEKEFDLTDYEYNKPKIPIKTEFKINGRHFRRVPDLILVY